MVGVVGDETAMTYQPSRVTERALQQRIIDTATALKWRSFHVFDSRRSEPGWPDLVLLRPPRLLFVELKSEKGRLTPEQQRWLDLLAQVPGVETAVWRPRDLPDAIDYLR